MASARKHQLGSCASPARSEDVSLFDKVWQAALAAVPRYLRGLTPLL